MNYVDPGKVIGSPLNRVDGPKKVTGTAIYTSDHHFDGMLYAVPVRATVAAGMIKTLDTTAAEKMPGVRLVLHSGNIGKLNRPTAKNGMIDERRPPLADNEVRYYGQYVAAVIADTFEQATAAADTIKVTYDAKPFNVKDELEPSKWTTDSQRGDVEKAFADAPVKVHL